MDCFVASLLAMTVERHDSAFSRHGLSESCSIHYPLITEGAGSADAQRTRGSHAEKNATGTPEHRHSLRNGLRLIRGLLGVPGLLASVARKVGVSGRRPTSPTRELDPSVGGSGQHDFARPRAARFVRARRPRPSLSASRFATIGRNVPGVEAGWRGVCP
jgi:hypothetical protein